MSITPFNMYERPCPVCDSKKYELLYENPDYRYLDVTGDIYVAPLRYVICQECAHIYKSPNIDTREMQDLYRNHMIENPGNGTSTRINHHFDGFLPLMTDVFTSTGAPLSILEIGCGNGELINRIHNEYPEQISYIKGIEPSIALYNYLVDKGRFEYENIFFEDLDLSDKYDLIILDNVFEHFDKPFDDLVRLKLILKENGVMYVSIPNILIHLTGFVDMFAGHPSNYVIENFNLLMNRAGFFVERFDYTHMWLNCVVRHKVEQDSLLKYDFETVKQEIQARLRQYIASNHSILAEIKQILQDEISALVSKNGHLLIFGGGNHTRELLNHIDFRGSICGIIDSNSMYHGKSRLGYPVYAPSQLDQLNYKKIIISSRAFQEEMKKTLIDQGVAAERIICLYD